MPFSRLLRLGTSLALACTVLPATLFAEGSPRAVAPAGAQAKGKQTQAQARLAAGETLVECENINGTRYVVGTILIDQPPQQVWTTLVNPFEFEGKICPRMSRVEVLDDEARLSRLALTMDLVFPLPDITYVVESRYSPPERVEFQRVSGAFKDIRGFWNLKAVNNGNSTEVTYSMYLDPGVPVPDWLVRQGVKFELPSTLTGLRHRLNQLKRGKAPRERRTILAASAYCPVQATPPAEKYTASARSAPAASAQSACPAFISPPASLAHPP